MTTLEIMTSDTDEKLQKWTTLTNETAFETPWFNIRKQHMRTPSGTELDYYVHDTNDSVICVCVNEDGNILVEQQYRPPVEKVSVDYPAGRTEADDESTEAAIVRELQEETGFTTSSIRKLAVIDKDPSFTKTRMHVFLAQGKIDAVATPEETESIVSSFVTPSEILTMIATGKMTCAFCLSATLLAFTELDLLKSSR